MKKERDFDEIISKRLKFALCICSLFLTICMVCTYIAMMKTQSSQSVLSEQYTKDLMVVYPRGTVYDRNGIPLTNRNSEYSFISVSQNIYNDVASNVIGDIRIDESNTTSSGCVGVSGIQCYYDSLLNGGAPIIFYAYVDAMGNIIGDNYFVRGDHINEGGNVYLTLDYNMQKNVEETLSVVAEENNFENIAAIITDVSSGEIMTMASYGGYMNHGVLSYQPGSIMKIITAAVAYDMGIIDENTKYFCKGTVEIAGIKKGCMYDTAHGEITVSDAFAVSCNCCFYDLAQKLTYKDESGKLCSYMLDKAKEWGFNEYGCEAINKFILEYAEHDSFVCTELFNDMDVFNSALGQGKIQASPYLINNITCAIASEGKSATANITKKATDTAGNELETGDEFKFNLNLKAETITWLKRAMEQTYISGTASKFDFSFCGGIAGKTGTAENVEGMDAHGWFTGYYPADNPKYAITVMIPNGKSGSNALMVTREIIETIESLG